MDLKRITISLNGNHTINGADGTPREAVTELIFICAGTFRGAVRGFGRNPRGRNPGLRQEFTLCSTDAAQWKEKAVAAGLVPKEIFGQK